MFEIGRDYIFTTGTGDKKETWAGEVLEVSFPLIRVTKALGELIINTHSSDFAGAEIRPYRTPEQKEADRIKWDGLINRPKGTDVA